MTNPNDVAAQFAEFQAFKASLATQGTVPGTDLPNVKAEQATEVAPTVDIELGDVLGGSAYGPALFEKDDPIGQTFTGTVAQPTDVKQQRDFKTGQPKFYDDGVTPVPYLIIGLDVPVSERHPDGRATWYARGKDIPEINRAMTEAGVPREVIKKGLEVGAALTVTYARNQVNPRFPASNPAKIRTVQYTRPNSAPAPVVAQAVPPQTTLTVAAVPAPAGGLARPEGLTDAQWEVYQKAIGQKAA